MEAVFSVNYDPATNKHFLHFIFGRNAIEHFLITAIGPLIGGLVAGSFIIFYQRDKLKGKTYTQKLLIHSTLYILFVVLCVLIVGVIGALNKSSDKSFWQNLDEDVLSLRVARLVFTWYFIVILTIFLLDVSEKYGTGTLRKLLLGRYHTPGQEDRIFMFLDLNASTTMAEQIGDEKYFEMLRFFYQAANEAIISCRGEIYQYVGDEIIISWPRSVGLKDENCIYCFEQIEKAVEENSDLFREKYGLVPSFKAGVHSGMVTAGEIGTIKKDIVYSGDVLNTTARIMALCKTYKVSLLVSERITNDLKESKRYEFQLLDKPVLRGKKDEMGLYAVRKTESPGSLYNVNK